MTFPYTYGFCLTRMSFCSIDCKNLFMTWDARLIIDVVFSSEKSHPEDGRIFRMAFKRDMEEWV